MAALSWRARVMAAAVGAIVLGGATYGADSDLMLTADVAAATTVAPVPPPPPEKSWVDQVKQPTDYFRWGADERLRIEYFDNAITLNQHAPGHEWDFFRYRTRVWASVVPVKDFELNIRMAWEGRHWQDPVSSSTKQGSAFKQEWDNGQVFFDNLNAKIRIEQIATTFTVGRQDIILGDGWLVLEGTPLDGSTSIYFDALRSTTTFKDVNTTLDLIYVNNYSDPDMWLVTMGDTDRPQIENDERGAIVWLANKSIRSTELDAYFIYKHDRAEFSFAKGGDNADIYTFGTRGVSQFTDNLKGRLEAAGQFGDKQSSPAGVATAVPQSLCAFGVTSRLTWEFKDPMKQELRLSAEYLSGDTPGDGTNQAFDPLWGRWPQWSELYVYTYAGETRIANATNLMRIAPGYVIRPVKDLEFETNYQALFANENTNRGLTKFATTGNYRGSLFTAVLRYRFNRFVSGNLVGEYFIPGNYYNDLGRDNAVYTRAELVLTF